MLFTSYEPKTTKTTELFEKEENYLECLITKKKSPVYETKYNKLIKASSTVQTASAIKNSVNPTTTIKSTIHQRTLSGPIMNNSFHHRNYSASTINNTLHHKNYSTATNPIHQRNVSASHITTTVHQRNVSTDTIA